MGRNEKQRAFLRSLTVLYVEDDEHLCRHFFPWLRRRVGRLLTAADGQAGFKAFRLHTPDIVITDIQMPQMDGLAMARKIRKANAKIPIIVATTHSKPELLPELVNLGIDQYLIKPVDTDHLYRALKKCAGRLLDEEQLNLAALAYQNSNEAMMVTNADGTIITVNPAFTKLTGYSADEAIGRNPKILKSDRHDQAFYQAMWHEINTTGHWKGEIWDRRKNGEIYAEWLTINTIFNQDGSVHRRVALFYDITERKRSEALIWQQANFDALTGLPNRHMFHDRLRQEIKKSQRAGLPMALLFIDLDRFKEINDTLGHGLGDALLKSAAQRLSKCVRQSDTVARLGGDEFTVILGGLEDVECVDRVAQDILRRLAEPFQLDDEEFAYMSASIGITLYPDDASDIESLLKNADQAMYAAKHQGRNRCIYFTPSMQQAAQTRMRLANDLHSALADDQFLLHYQPIVDLTTGSICKAEALIRWVHPKLGLISPGEFIPIAEENGIIIDIGNWVFKKALQQVELWRTRQPSFQITVNKSPVQFRSMSSDALSWPQHLHSAGLPGQCLVIEITEGLLLDASDITNEKLIAFRNAGIQVSLDDFGTGYSSLAYLKKFDIDYLKIDQSFVRNLTVGSDDIALCEAIIVMAHKLGMKVIAEGVETVEQRDLLKAAGCDYGQGYLFSRPLPADKFDEVLGLNQDF